MALLPGQKLTAPACSPAAPSSSVSEPTNHAGLEGGSPESRLWGQIDPTEILWDVQEVPLSIQPQAWVTVLALCLFPPLTELVRLALSPQPAGRGAELDFVPLPGML